MESHFSLLTWTALTLAVLAAILLLGFLIRRPPLVFATKAGLALALGVLPLAAAMLGNVQSFETMKTRRFCGSCHVMEAHAGDAASSTSRSLAATHSRNPAFGGESCYTCHADYGMYGGVFTKLNGSLHVYHYVLTYRSIPLQEAIPRMHLYNPYPNRNCMQCHTTSAPRWLAQSDHAAQLSEIASGRTSCVGSGCHGPVHPFSKPRTEETR